MTLKQTKTETKERIQHILNNHNNRNFYKVTLGTNQFRIKELYRDTFLETSISVETENLLVIEFRHYTEIVKKRKHRVATREHESYEVLSADMRFYKDCFGQMLNYWKQYAALKKIPNLVFTYSKELTSSLWHKIFNKAKKDVCLPGEMIDVLEKINKGGIIECQLTKEFIDSLTRFTDAIQMFKTIAEKEPLLQGINEKAVALFYEALTITYVGTTFIIEITDRTSFSEVKIIRDYDSQKFTKLGLNEKDLLNYFHDFKIERRLFNEIQRPMTNFRSLLSRLGVTNPNNTQEQFKSLCDTLGDWESAEAEMLKIRLNPDFSPEKYQIFNQMDFIKDETLRVYHFQTDKWNFLFEIVLAAQSTKPNINLFQVHVVELEDAHYKLKEIYMRWMF